MSSVGKKSVRYNTDEFALKLFRELIRDFRLVQGASFYCEAETALNTKGILGIRNYVPPKLGIISPYRFKMYNQLNCLFKKYRFEHDMFSDDELKTETLKKFHSDQSRICRRDDFSYRAKVVLSAARKIAKQILGPYNPEKTWEYARFGKKSSIGCPLNLAYIDEKLTNMAAFTGSSECSKWFLSGVHKDYILKQLLEEMPTLLKNKGKHFNFEHESLSLVLVPKSWKICRSITPLTLLSLFYSFGVGEQVTNRLKEVGLDISKLQLKHRNIIQRFSRTRNDTTIGGLVATADLSSASDSITSRLLNRILPRDWYMAVKKTFCHQLLVDGVPHYTDSILPMGNGLTFPVETLIFYCIIKAVGTLSRTDGIFSVYGDDLIYPSKLHGYISTIFAECGFVMNLEKTFVTYPYRESCGAEYYRGIDVRPFFLPGQHQLLTSSKYLAWLYQLYNGLARRWDECEIRRTLTLILAEIQYISDKGIYRVPPLFPDTAGIRVDKPTDIPLKNGYLNWVPICCYFANGSRWFRFNFLQSATKDRYVTSVLPYYWLALQGKNDDIPNNFWNIDFSSYSEPSRSSLRWKTVTVKKKRRRGFEIVNIETIVCDARSSEPSYIHTRTSAEDPISDWIDDSFHLL